MQRLKNERYTENIVEQEMKIETYGDNSFGKVFIQGEKTGISNIDDALILAGGKPEVCELEDYTSGGKGHAEPEYVITLKKDLNTVIVIECKKSIKDHESEYRNKPKKYAVDGVLYYAKFLKDNYNVIAIAVSGTEKEKIKTNAFYWVKNQKDYSELLKTKDIILEPENYLKLVNGEKVQKQYSLEEINQTAVTMHESLRQNKMTEKLKPLFIAGILIALQDEDFSESYDKLTNFKLLLNACCSAIEVVLGDGEIESKKIDEIKGKFKEIEQVIGLRDKKLEEDYSLRWYINQLEMKIKPMMEYVGNTIDALGVFYHEFISYSSGDGNSLGIVLTPQHLTEFMSEIIEVDKNSKVLDICCGSGAFLVTSMGKMFKQATTTQEIEYIRKNNLYGVEADSDIHTLALANMIIRKDGKSHIIHGDCFDKKIVSKLINMKDENGKNISFNKALLNPPYSQKDHCELEFVEQALNLLNQGGELAVVCPMSCAIGTKFKDVRKRLFDKHTLKAVFSMPSEIFDGNGASTNVCVMLWEAKKPHNSKVSTFFGYYKDDGFVKRKKLGRIDAYNRWQAIKDEWIRLYKEKELKDGLSSKSCVTYKDEWLCEAYMKTDFSKVKKTDFEKTIRNYFSYLIKEDEIVNIDERKFKITNEEVNLNTDNWKEFSISELFSGKKIKRGKRLRSEDRIPGDLKYFSASQENNGLTDHISEPLFIENNALIYTTFGDCYYVEGNFTASDEISIFKDKNVNKYNGLFIATILNQNKYKYAFGRKAFKNKYQNDIIKLPVKFSKSGELLFDDTYEYSKKGYIPDFEFMEEYIKTLKYSDRI